MEIYLTIAELAGMVKLSEQTVRWYVLNRTIPYRKIRKAVRFRLSEIEKWIDGGCVADNARELLNSVEREETETGLLDFSDLDTGSTEADSNRKQEEWAGD